MMFSYCQGVVHALPHPLSPGGAILVVGTANGTIAAYESLGSSEAHLIDKVACTGSVLSVSSILEELQVCFRLAFPVLPSWMLALGMLSTSMTDNLMM